MSVASCAICAAPGASVPTVAATPKATPDMPSTLPSLAVLCEDSPPIPPMQHTADAMDTSCERNK